MTAAVSAVLAYEDAGFILASYAITLGVVAAFAWRAVRVGRRLADQIDDERKYWT